MEEDDLELSFEDIVNAQAILGGADSDDSSSAAPTSTSASASAPSSAASDNGPAAAAPLARVVSRSGSGVLVLGGGSQLPESSTDDDDGLLGPPSAPVAVPTPAAAGDDDFARLLADGSDRSGRASPVSETEQYIARLSSSPRSGSHADLGDAGLPQQFPADTGSPRSPALSRSSSSGSNGVGSPLVSRKPSLTLLGVTQDDSNTETDTDAGLLSDAAAAAAAAAAVPASSAEAFLASVDPDDMAFDAVLSAAAAVAGSPRMPASPHDSPERELAVSVPKHLHFSDAFVSVPSADIDTDDPSLDIVVPVVQAKEDLTQHVSPPAASSLQRRGSSQDVHLRHMLAKRVASGDIDGAAAQEAEAAIQAERLAHELSNGVGGAAGPAYVEGRDNGSHAHFVNGNYVVKEGAIFDDRPVLVHEEAIPPGFADASGKHLHMYYHSENEAWAISTELGSLDVLAYILGDVFDKDFEPGSYGPVVWNVSNGHGDYEVDEHLVMRGSAVPPAVAQAFGFDSPTLPDAQVPAGAHAIPVDELAIATGAAMASSPVISPVTSPHELLHDFGESSTDDDESPVAAMRSGSQDNMAPSAAKVELIEPEAVSISRTEMFGPDSSSGMGPSSANPQHRRPPRNHIYEELPEPQQGGASLNDAAQGMRQRSQSFKEKAAAKIKSGAKRLKKSGLRGLGGR